jgi:hypothetical protein
MTPPPVFTAWTSTWFSPELERESKEGRPEEESSEDSRELARKSQSNGSLRDLEVPFSEQQQPTKQLMGASHHPAKLIFIFSKQHLRFNKQLIYISSFIVSILIVLIIYVSLHLHI